MAYIFQYGSNVSIDRINSANRLNGAAKFISIARTINEYEFCFTVWSKKNKCAAADIIQGKGRKIIGVLYEIPDDKVFRDKCSSKSLCLDRIEGEGSTYKRINIELEDFEGHPIEKETLTYIVNEERRQYGLKTSQEYFSHIIEGLKKLNIESNYIEYIFKKAKDNNPEITLK